MKNQGILLPFCTENKVKHYKRIIVGVNSALGELQQTSQTILADIDGLTNIADDILIYGITIEQDDKALADVLQCLAQTKPTIKLPRFLIDQQFLKWRSATITFENY